MDTAPRALHRTLTTVEYFTFGFGTMVGVGWLVLIDDWLGRGGPGGAVLGFLLGGLLLVPIAHTYGRLVRQIPDAGAEIAYTEGVLSPFLGFVAGWTMVLAYAIVCPWEAVAIGNLLARVFPALNSHPLYEMAGRPIFAPRLVAGLVLTLCIAAVNYRGIRSSGLFQDVTTFGLLIVFGVFAALGFARGEGANLQPLFSHPGPGGAAVSVLLVMQIVPYFMTGFESVAKGSEESRPGFDPRNFSRAIFLAVVAGFVFYVVVVAVVSYVFPWQELVSKGLGTEAAFEHAFGSKAIARLIMAGAFLSLLKVFNGNFVASTRLLFAIGRRRLVHPALAAVHPRFGTPSRAIVMMALMTAAASLLGDALLVPITEVGSLAVGIGWLSACVAYILRSRGSSVVPASVPGQKSRIASNAAGLPSRDTMAAYAGAAVSIAIVLMKVVPAVPGSFTSAEWVAFGLWSGLGLMFWWARAKT